MKIEQAIKQKSPFASEKEKVTVNILYTCNWIMTRQKELFKPFNLTVQQYNVLRILRGQYPDPISTSEIRERMLDKMSDASRIVDRLVKKELVERKTCKTDKRLVDIVITEQGLDLLEETNDALNKEVQQMVNISATEAEILNQLLDKLRG